MQLYLRIIATCFKVVVGNSWFNILAVVIFFLLIHNVLSTLIERRNSSRPNFVAICKWFVLVLIKALTMYLISFFLFFFFAWGSDVRSGGEYPLIRVFMNVFSRRATGFHREEKLIDLKVFYTKSFHQVVKPAGQIWSICPVSDP